MVRRRRSGLFRYREAEEFRVHPDVGAVVGYIEGYVADYFDAPFLAVLFEAAPLAKEEILRKLGFFDVLGKQLLFPCKRFLVLAAAGKEATHTKAYLFFA